MMIGALIGATIGLALFVGAFLGDRRARKEVDKVIESALAHAEAREKLAAQQIAHAYESSNRLMTECRQVIAESRVATREALAESTAIARLAAVTMFGSPIEAMPPAASVNDNDRAAARKAREQGQQG